MNEIIVLEQIENRITLYANCFKSGYTMLYYYSNPLSMNVVKLERPEITIHGLEESSYWFFCVNDKEERIGEIQVTISNVSRNNFLQNILFCGNLTDAVYMDIIHPLKTDDYIMELYNLYLSATEDQDKYLEILALFCQYHNLRQDSLNNNGAPLFKIDNVKIEALDGLKYDFVPYVYENGWKLLQYQKVHDADSFQLSGKSSRIHLIYVLSDFKIVRKYFIYQPSKTLSETKYESQISAAQRLSEHTLHLSTQFDLSELYDDEHGQNIVAALQYLKPERYIFKTPRIEYDGSHFSVEIDDYNMIFFFKKKLYLGALELDQVYADHPAPHKIHIQGTEFRFDPVGYLMNFEEEYIFFICDEDGIILSIPIAVSYATEYNLTPSLIASRKIDIQYARRRLFNIFKEYDRKDWDLISSILDNYILRAELTDDLTEFIIQEITKLDETKFQIDLLIKLVLLSALQHIMPLDKQFLSKQVYERAYKKHVLPESEEHYIVKITYIDGNKISYAYTSGGPTVVEIKLANYDFMMIQAFSNNAWKCASIAFYNNRILDGAPYFYYPDLEVIVQDGLY